MNVTEGLVGRALALAAHPVCRDADPGGTGMTIGDVEASVTGAGIQIGGTIPRRALGAAVNNAQDLFEQAPGGRWRWIEPVPPQGAELSGAALAEEAYRLVMRHDPDRGGLHYHAVLKLLADDGVIIRGPNRGKTVFTALHAAERWFEWVSSGTFRWKL